MNWITKMKQLIASCFVLTLFYFSGTQAALIGIDHVYGENS